MCDYIKCGLHTTIVMIMVMYHTHINSKFMCNKMTVIKL